MVLTVLLIEKREAVLGRWFDSIIKTYPPGTSEFLAKQKDRFRNPVGHAIAESIGSIYDEIVSEMDTGELRRALDGIIRIRSVQDFTASEAVAFVFQLKTVVREVLGNRIDEHEHSHELADLESRIDQVALLAFDKYMECRDKLHEVRTNEIRRRSEILFEKVNVGCGVSRHEGGPVDDGS
ncbi:MAG: RsbRD N-terminal domain-containing protein [Candidatus Latescibacterota bacterium]|nr:MAG: RsbRD N-terminal domain-containing protein [Candidatus Latescibacterota bacterium]